MRQALATLIALIFAQASLAQPNPDTLWTRTYGGNNYDEAYSVQQTADGGYVVAGYTQSFGAGNYDFYVVKTNSLGDTLWTRTYGGNDYDRAFSIQETSDGGYIMAGYSSSFGAGNNDFYVVKTNSQGDTLWTRTYGGSGLDEALSVQQTADGGYIVAGKTRSFDIVSYDFYVVKTDSLGDTLWTRTYGGSNNDFAYSVQQTADRGYIVAGYTESFGAGGYDFYVVKTNGLGDTLWTRTYGGQFYDWAYSVQQTTDGGYVVAGHTLSFGLDNYNFYLVKADSQGDTLWTRTYGGRHDDYGKFVQQTTDRGYILAGYTLSSGAGDFDFYLIKADSLGDTLWTRTYGGSNDDYAYFAQQTADGGYIVAGYTRSFGAGAEDFYLVKTGPDISSAEPLKNPFPADYALCPSWPNPFNPTTTIRYDVRKTGHVSLKVFDLLGREVTTLVQGTVPVGSYAVTWDAADLPSGIYFCRMEAEGFVQTRKMVLLK